MPVENIRKHLETEQRYHLIDLVAKQLQEIRMSIYENLNGRRSNRLANTLFRGRSKHDTGDEILFFLETMDLLSGGEVCTSALLELAYAKNGDDIPPIQEIAEALQEIYDHRALIQLYEIMLNSAPDDALVKGKEVEIISNMPEYRERANTILAGVPLEDVLGDWTGEAVFETA